MWDERFSGLEYVYGTEPNDFLVSVATKIPQGKILCLADGEGRNGTYLATLGYDVVAVDGSSVGLAKTQKLAQEKQVEIITIHADLADFVIEPQAWDGIVAIFCHLPPDLRAKVYRQSVIGLKPNGVFVLEAFAPKQLQYNTGGPKNIDMLPALSTLQQELTGLDWEIARSVERDLDEGRHHNGTAAVIQILGRK